MINKLKKAKIGGVTDGTELPRHLYVDMTKLEILAYLILPEAGKWVATDTLTFWSRDGK